MISVIQLVTFGQVDIAEKCVAHIDRGILALVGFEKTDTAKEAERLLERILTYRIFPDAAGRMNLSLKDIQGGLLLVPQFTLVAETNKGTRPGFSIGMSPEDGKQMFAYVIQHANKIYPHVQQGQFGANMQVSLCNDGPATFILSVN